MPKDRVFGGGDTVVMLTISRTGRANGSAAELPRRSMRTSLAMPEVRLWLWLRLAVSSLTGGREMTSYATGSRAGLRVANDSWSDGSPPALRAFGLRFGQILDRLPTEFQ